MSWGRRPVLSPGADADALPDGDDADVTVCGHACGEIGGHSAGFNELLGYAMDCKPFYDQLAEREFAPFMPETARR